MAATKTSTRPWTARLVFLVVVIGAALRIVYTAGSDVRNVHDDHFHFTRIILNEKRWPQPTEGWQTYQPPLYYALSALAYRVCKPSGPVPAPVQPTPQEASSGAGPRSPYPDHVAGRKAIQFLSTLSGVLTLVLVWLILRSVFAADYGLQCVGVTFAAFLPRHIYMSGMASNDAMTYLWATLCLYALVRALPLLPPATRLSDHRSGKHLPARTVRPYGWWIVAAVAAALAMWTKQYGLGSVAVLAATVMGAGFLRDHAARRVALRGGFLALALALGLGTWPYVRMWRLTGDPLASNYTLRQHNMDAQLPGSVTQTSFLSLRLPSLLVRPWVHISTVSSYWTAIFAELWFDYGTSTTIYQYRPWLNHVWPIWSDRSLDARQRERQGLMWDTTVTSPPLLWQGRALILLGIMPTALIVIGFFSLWRRLGLGTSLILAMSLATGAATPLFQTLRQPFRSSMKATFILCALAAMAALCALGWRWLLQRRYGRYVGVVLAVNLLLLALVVIWHFGYLSIIFPHTPEYFARRDPL